MVLGTEQLSVLWGAEPLPFRVDLTLEKEKFSKISGLKSIEISPAQAAGGFGCNSFILKMVIAGENVTIL